MGARAGQFRHRIAIDQLILTQDPNSGAEIRKWEVLYPSVPAAIEPLSTREFISARSMQSKMVARIRIRYMDGLDATNRIRHLGKIYNVEGWLPDTDSGIDYLTAPVSEGVNNG